MLSYRNLLPVNHEKYIHSSHAHTSRLLRPYYRVDHVMYPMREQLRIIDYDNLYYMQKHKRQQQQQQQQQEHGQERQQEQQQQQQQQQRQQQRQQQQQQQQEQQQQ